MENRRKQSAHIFFLFERSIYLTNNKYSKLFWFLVFDIMIKGGKDKKNTYAYRHFLQCNRLQYDYM